MYNKIIMHNKIIMYYKIIMHYKRLNHKLKATFNGIKTSASLALRRNNGIKESIK